MNKFVIVQATVPHNLKDPHSKTLEPDCLAPFVCHYDTVSVGGGNIFLGQLGACMYLRGQNKVQTVRHELMRKSDNNEALRPKGRGLSVR